MNGPEDVIILKRHDGPVYGLTIVTVDAPGYTQAEFVIDTALVDTPGERELLWHMMKERLALMNTLKEERL